MTALKRKIKYQRVIQQLKNPRLKKEMILRVSRPESGSTAKRCLAGTILTDRVRRLLEILEFCWRQTYFSFVWITYGGFQNCIHNTRISFQQHAPLNKCTSKRDKQRSDRRRDAPGAGSEASWYLLGSVFVSRDTMRTDESLESTLSVHPWGPCGLREMAAYDNISIKSDGEHVRAWALLMADLLWSSSGSSTLAGE